VPKIVTFREKRDPRRPLVCVFFLINSKNYGSILKEYLSMMIFSTQRCKCFEDSSAGRVELNFPNCG